MGSFSDKAGFVTGAGGGIGRATAIALAREGAAVILADIEAMRTQSEETIQKIVDAGGRAKFRAVDVSVEEDVKALVSDVVDSYKSLDFCFNNAGILKTGFTAQIEEKDFKDILAVDTIGVWLCMKHAILHMQQHGGGSIVNTASEAGLVGTPLAGAYVAAKHAVVGLTKTAAGEYANMNIRINAVAPGAIATPMVLSLPQEVQDVLISPQPMHRLGTPEEVAEPVVFLLSDKASFITGAILSIDGGATSNAQSFDPALSPNKPAV
jgi:NAD(P)-dependent dehydrogenase (short-subunit alcohol dehydrogenase family)